MLEPEILPDGTKHFELTASIVDWEVAPGEIVQAWAYNGIVPGPRINVEVGDTVEFELTNDLPIGTDIHWHGIDVPNEHGRRRTDHAGARRSRARRSPTGSP